MNKFTTQYGLLYNHGNVCDVILADSFAKEYGFQYAEQFVQALEKGESGYIAMCDGKTIKVWGSSIMDAKEKAKVIMKPKKYSSVNIMLACLKGEDYQHATI